MKRRGPNPRVIYRAHESDEWHTPAKLRALAHDVLGPIDLDPATDDRNRLGAARYFTRADDGTKQDWNPPPGATPGSVWMNPPYGNKAVPLWCALWLAYVQFWNVRALALLPARVGARWYEQITTNVQLVCELRGRVRFDLPSGERARDCARWGNILVYCGPDRAAVKRLLDQHGATRLVLPSQRIPRELASQRSLERRGQLRLVPP